MECVRGLSATIYLFNWAKSALVLNTGGELEWVIFSKNGTLLSGIDRLIKYLN